MLTFSVAVDDVEMQRRRVVRKLDKFATTCKRRRGIEHVDERDRREHARTTTRASRNCRGLETVGQRNQAARLVRIEDDLVAVVVEDREAHDATVPAVRP